MTQLEPTTPLPTITTTTTTTKIDQNSNKQSQISLGEPDEEANGPTRNVQTKTSRYPTISRKRADMVLHYSFEKLDAELVLDESGFSNNGKIIEGRS